MLFAISRQCFEIDVFDNFVHVFDVVQIKCAAHAASGLHAKFDNRFVEEAVEVFFFVHECVSKFVGVARDAGIDFDAAIAHLRDDDVGKRPDVDTVRIDAGIGERGGDGFYFALKLRDASVLVALVCTALLCAQMFEVRGHGAVLLLTAVAVVIVGRGVDGWSGHGTGL